jgi:hypothetical protein
MMNAAVKTATRNALRNKKVGTPSCVNATSTSSNLRGFATSENEQPLTRTALYDLHLELGGTMVPFAGYELPVHYQASSSGNGGVLKEHLWCRSDGKASLFDVSHMGQVRSSST